MPQDNEEVKATLLEGNTRYSSAATVMGNVATELGTIIASVDLSMKGNALDAYTTTHNQFVKDIGVAQEVLQKFGGALVTLHDKIVEAEQEAQKAKDNDLTANMLLLGVLMFPAVVAAAVMPILEAADTAAATVISDVTKDVEAIVGDTSLDNDITLVGDMNPVDVSPDGVDTTIPDPEQPNAVPAETPQNVPNGAPEATTPETPGAPTPETPGAPTPETPGPTTPETPEATTPETPGAPTPETPGSPTPETPDTLGDTPPETYDTPANVPGERDSGFFDGPSEPGKPGDLPLGKSTSGKNLDDFLPPRPVEVEVNVVKTDGLGITMDHPPADATVIEGPSQETFVDSVTGNTTVADIDAAGNETITVTDPAGNTTLTEYDPYTENTQTTEIFTDPQTGNTTVTHSTIDTDPVNGSVTETETVIHPDGSQTITETVTETDGNTIETVFEPDGTITETETQADGTKFVTKHLPDGTTVETDSEPNGTTKNTETRPDGSTTVSETDTVVDPVTQQPTKVDTVTHTTAPDTQGNVTITEIVTDPKTGHTHVIEQKFDSYGNPTGMPTSVEIDANGKPVQPSQAGPSQPPKRPAPDSDPDSSPDPSDPKGKKVKR